MSTSLLTSASPQFTAMPYDQDAWIVPSHSLQSLEQPSYSSLPTYDNTNFYDNLSLAPSTCPWTSNVSEDPTSFSWYESQLPLGGGILGGHIPSEVSNGFIQTCAGPVQQFVTAPSLHSSVIWKSVAVPSSGFQGMPGIHSGNTYKANTLTRADSQGPWLVGPAQHAGRIESTTMQRSRVPGRTQWAQKCDEAYEANTKRRQAVPAISFSSVSRTCPSVARSRAAQKRLGDSNPYASHQSCMLLSSLVTQVNRKPSRKRRRHRVGAVDFGFNSDLDLPWQKQRRILDYGSGV